MASEAYDHHKGSAPLLRPTNRWRMGVFLLINLLGFVLVNAFWLYLSTGKWVDFSPAGYHRGLAIPIGEMLIHPLNVFTHPWMILVLGLLLAVVVFVPIIVAVLYRLLVAAAFVGIIAVFGHAPVLAAAVGIGCLLAARTSLRSDMPFLATLLGLLPVAVYLYLFAFLGTDAAVLASQRLVLSLPFLVGGVAAILSAAVVLALARVTGFRPGVVWPVLAVLLAAPAAMFYTRIGVDELQYIQRVLSPAPTAARCLLQRGASRRRAAWVAHGPQRSFDRSAGCRGDGRLPPGQSARTGLPPEVGSAGRHLRGHENGGQPQAGCRAGHA